MADGKRALAQMTPVQILAMSALGQAPAILGPMLKMSGLVKPPYNLIISNVPGPRTTQYFNGMRLEGTYPLSIPIDGMALNITCNSYADQMAFGLTGCRRTVPHLQRLLTPPRLRARRPRSAGSAPASAASSGSAGASSSARTCAASSRTEPAATRTRSRVRCRPGGGHRDHGTWGSVTSRRRTRIEGPRGAPGGRP